MIEQETQWTQDQDTHDDMVRFCKYYITYNQTYCLAVTKVESKPYYTMFLRDGNPTGNEYYRLKFNPYNHDDIQEALFKADKHTRRYLLQELLQ